MLGRAELLGVVAEAASAAAAGSPVPAAAAGLGGRRFTLRLPFGCFGPAPESGAGYVHDPEKGTLKVTVRPEAWTDAPWASDLVGSAETESIEGFWLRRPWLTAEACPATRGEAAVESSPETVGLARVFQEGGSRLPRRGGRAYEVTEKVAQGDSPVDGFRLVLQGRIAAPAEGAPVRCRSEHPDRRPLCLVIVEVDSVALEDARGRRLGEWGT